MSEHAWGLHNSIDQLENDTMNKLRCEDKENIEAYKSKQLPILEHDARL